MSGKRSARRQKRWAKHLAKKEAEIKEKEARDAQRRQRQEERRNRQVRLKERQQFWKSKQEWIDVGMQIIRECEPRLHRVTKDLEKSSDQTRTRMLEEDKKQIENRIRKYQRSVNAAAYDQRQGYSEPESDDWTLCQADMQACIGAENCRSWD